MATNYLIVNCGGKSYNLTYNDFTDALVDYATKHSGQLRMDADTFKAIAATNLLNENNAALVDAFNSLCKQTEQHIAIAAWKYFLVFPTLPAGVDQGIEPTSDINAHFFVTRDGRYFKCNKTSAITLSSVLKKYIESELSYGNSFLADTALWSDIDASIGSDNLLRVKTFNAFCKKDKNKIVLAGIYSGTSGGELYPPKNKPIIELS